MTRGDWIDPARGRVTFGDYAPGWLEARTSAKPKTRRQQASLLRLHILPFWRPVQLDRTTFEDLAYWVADLAAGGCWSFTRRRIDVRRTFSDVSGKIMLGTPKSHLARTVPLPRFLAAELARLRPGQEP